MVELLTKTSDSNQGQKVYVIMHFTLIAHKDFTEYFHSHDWLLDTVLLVISLM